MDWDPARTKLCFQFCSIIDSLSWTQITQWTSQLLHALNSCVNAFLLHKSASRWSYTAPCCGQLLLQQMGGGQQMLKSTQGPAKRCLSCYCSLRPSEPQKAQPVVVWPPILPLHLKLSTGESTELLRRGTGSVPSAQSTHQYHQKPYTNQSHLKIFGKVSLSTKWLSAASD